MNKKMVIFRELGKLRVTPEENYNAFIRNARKVADCSAFDDADEVIDYYIKHFNSTRDDFIVLA